MIYLKIKLIVFALLFGIASHAQPLNFVLCPFTEKNVVKGTYIECYCDLYYNFTANETNTILVESDSSFYDISVGSYYKKVINGQMKVVAKLSPNSLILNGPVYYIFMKDTIFRGEHLLGKPVGKAMFAFQRDTITGSFKDGKLDGNVYGTYADSTKMFVQYKNGKKHGTQYSLYANGRLNLFIEFRNGVKYGAEAKFYKNGALNYIVPFKKGKMVDGKYYEYAEDGNINVVIISKKGKIKVKYLQKELPPFLMD